jgi:hypothetical protein
MDIPVPFLSLAYWLHMLATLVWIGGLSAMAILILPAARRALDASAYARLLADLQRRLDPLRLDELDRPGGHGVVPDERQPKL